MDQEYLPENSFYQHFADFQERSGVNTLNTLFYLSDMRNMDNILEIGAGSGSMFPLALQHKKASAEYTAIDISKEFLQCCQQRLEFLEKQNLPQQLQDVPRFKIKKTNPEDKTKFSYTNKTFNFNLKEMSLEKMEFPDNTFDGYFEVNAMHHCDWDLGLEEAARVLKSGGRLCLGEFGENVFKDMKDFGEEIDILIKQLYGDTYKKSVKKVNSEFGGDPTKVINNKEGVEKSEQTHHHHHHHHHHDHNHGHGHDHDHKHGEGDNNHHHHHHVNIWDKEKIKTKLQALGFKEIMAFDQYVPMNYTKETCIDTYLLRDYQGLKSDLPKEQQDELLQKIYDIAKVRNDNRDIPRGYNAILIVATKI